MSVTITNGYCTLGQLKLEEGISDTVDDDVLSTAINAASRQVDGYCGWRFWQDATVKTRTFYATNPRQCDLLEDPSGEGISTTTGLIVGVDLDNNYTFETTLVLNTDFIVAPVNAALRVPVWPYTMLQIINPTGASWFPQSLYGTPTIQVTAKFGWPAVPDDITKACLIQAQMLANANQAAFGISQLSMSDGTGMRASAWNPLARALLEPYRKPALG